MGTTVSLLHSTEHGDQQEDGHSQDGANDNNVLAPKELAAWQGQPMGSWSLVCQLSSCTLGAPGTVCGSRQPAWQLRGTHKGKGVEGEGMVHARTRDRTSTHLPTFSRLPPMQLEDWLALCHRGDKEAIHVQTIIQKMCAPQSS